MTNKNEVETGEWNRLVKDAYHALEFLVTMHYLRKYLPETGKILDAGGGPGRYALELWSGGMTLRGFSERIPTKIYFLLSALSLLKQGASQ